MEGDDLNDGAIREGEPPYYGRMRRSGERLPGADTRSKAWMAWPLTILGGILLLPAAIYFLYIAPRAPEAVPQLPPKVVQHEPWFTNGDPAARPFASRREATITLEPSKASLRIPDSWLQWHGKFGNNIHLTHDQLDAVARGDGQWDTEFASVCNAVLPFDRCAGHVGGEGWGRQAVAYSDLQVRVYDLEDEPEEIERRITGDGAADIKRFLGKGPALKQDLTTPWRQTHLSFERFYCDGDCGYGATAIVEFRVRQFEKRTFTFVFMYTSHDSQDKDIASILASFKAR